MRGLRLLVIVALVLVGLVWLAWRSGERHPVDEIALAEAAASSSLSWQAIPAGGSTPFVAVFRSVPDEAAQFSLRVVEAPTRPVLEHPEGGIEPGEEGAGTGGVAVGVAEGIAVGDGSGVGVAVGGSVGVTVGGALTLAAMNNVPHTATAISTDAAPTI